MEVLAGGACGVLVSPNNVEQLADAIIRLASNPNEMKRLGSWPVNALWINIAWMR